MCLSEVRRLTVRTRASSGQLARGCRRFSQGFHRAGKHFLRAVPETGLVAEARRHLRLHVQIANKLNRSHVALPVAGRESPPGERRAARIHGGFERVYPGLARLPATGGTEPTIVAELAKATVTGTFHSMGRLGGGPPSSTTISSAAIPTISRTSTSDSCRRRLPSRHQGIEARVQDA